MTPIKSSFILAIISFGLGFLACLSTFKKPEPEIKYVEKIVEVEKKSTQKKSVKKTLPDGTILETTDEISDFLKSTTQDVSLKAAPASPRHQILPIYTLKGTWGGQYLHNFTPNIVGGAGYKDGAFLTFGVQF